MDLWPHQPIGIREVLAARAGGEKRICLSSPTGGGKTRMVEEIARAVLAEGHEVALYSNRKYLIEQLSAKFLAAGIYHGIRASGHEDESDCPFQICSMQTEGSRVLKRKTMDLHACGAGDLAVIDEGHLHRGKQAMEIRQRHVDGGAMTLDVTATPLGMAETCDRLIVAGKPSELRACGALVEARHFGCDEPDLKAFKKMKKFGPVSEGEDLSERQNRAAMMTPGIMGRVWKWYEQLNPERKPALLFGPGVAESLWFAERFAEKGVKAAHIDGDDVWVDGAFHSSSPSLRDEIQERHKSGDIQIVCNRFVLREGVDWPWVQHIVLAYVAGNLQTYLQVGGRGLRAYPGKDCCTIQDHGGAWHRHGSLNEDREWKLELTPEVAFGLRADRLRNKKKTEPFLCPGCGRVWTGGRTCNEARGGCGHVMDYTRKSRAVVSTDGTLRELHGDAFPPRRITKDPRGPAIWERMYWRSRTDKGKRTFAAAAALFAHENRFGWPDRSWAFMPVQDEDWFRMVPDVPMERLIQKEAAHA